MLTEHAQKHEIWVRFIIDVRIATRVIFNSNPNQIMVYIYVNYYVFIYNYYYYPLGALYTFFFIKHTIAILW